MLHCFTTERTSDVTLLLFAFWDGFCQHISVWLPSPSWVLVSWTHTTGTLSGLIEQEEQEKWKIKKGLLVCTSCIRDACYTSCSEYGSAKLWYALLLLFFLRFSSVSLHCSPIQFSFAFFVHLLMVLFTSFISQILWVPFFFFRFSCKIEIYYQALAYIMVTWIQDRWLRKHTKRMHSNQAEVKLLVTRAWLHDTVPRPVSQLNWYVRSVYTRTLLKCL